MTHQQSIEKATQKKEKYVFKGFYIAFRPIFNIIPTSENICK